jgi:hypothetical protein
MNKEGFYYHEDIIGNAVLEQAQSIFEECGYPKDFCVQCAKGLIFGGWNRITLTSKGWYAHKESCTPRFYAEFQKKFGRLDE